MNGIPESAAAEWRRYWPVVLTGFFGMSFAAVPMQSVAFFIDPVRAEFGWSRTEVTIGASVFGLVSLLAPFAGAIQDALGPRRLAIGGVTLCIAALVSLSFATGSLGLWIGQWTFFALAELFIKATLWLAVVNRVFVHAKGMAIALVLCGTFMAQTLTPLLAYYLIEQFGWRPAYSLIGIGWGGSTLLLVLLFFHEQRGAGRGPSAIAKPGETPPSQLTGLTIRQALRCLALYRIAIALTLYTALSLAVVTHKVSILGEMGMSRGQAALIAAAAGISAIAGQLGTGWLFDRSRSTWIGVSAFALAAMGFVLLLEPVRSPGLIVTAMILFGVSSGAVLQATMYLTAQYCGQRNFGKIFGAKSCLFSIGLGGGPLLGAAIVDGFGSYNPLFVLAVPVSVLCSLLVFRLGPCPDWQEPAPAPGISSAASAAAA